MINTIKQVSNHANSDFGRRAACTITRSGDLISRAYHTTLLDLKRRNIYNRKYDNFIIIENKDVTNITNDDFELFQIKFYEDYFAGKITVENEINNETIYNYIKKFAYDLSDFYNTFFKII